MAGGKGTRLWPLSKEAKPKQFISLLNGKSLFEQTLSRIDQLPKVVNFIHKQNIITVTSPEYKDLSEKQYNKMGIAPNLVIEPEGRNTGPCIFLGLCDLLAKGSKKDEVVVILAADHHISREQAFLNDMSNAIDFATKNDALVTIGIRPTSPHTGYGYLETIGSDGSDQILKVQKFKEKPNEKTAIEYIGSGRYFWNAGMFVGTIKSFIDEFEKHAPGYYQKMNSLVSALKKEENFDSVYSTLEATSIDYAVMEKSDSIFMVPSSFDWSDLGDYSSLQKALETDNTNNNVHLENNEVIEMESSHCLTSIKGKKVILLGLEDIALIEKDNVIMALNMKHSQLVKKVTQEVKKNWSVEL